MSKWWRNGVGGCGGGLCVLAVLATACGNEPPGNARGSGGAASSSALVSGGTGGSVTNVPCCEEEEAWGPPGWNGAALSRVVPTDTRAAVQAATPPPAISGGTLGTTADGAFIVVADPDRDRIVVVNASTLEKREIALEPGDEPGRVAAGRGETVFVALRGGGAVVTLDPTQGLLARRVACLAPRGLAYDATTDELHVACADGKLVTFTGTTAEPSRVLPLDTDLRDVIVTNGRLLVSRMRSAELLELDGTGQIVKRLLPPTLEGSAVVPGANAATPGASVPTSRSSFVPEVAWRTLKGPDGDVHMLHQRGQEAVVALSHDDQNVIDWAGAQGASNPCGGIVRNSVTRFGADGLAHAELAPAVPLAVDAAISPNGRYFAIASAGAANPSAPQPSFVNAQTGQPAPPQQPPAPPAELGGIQVLPIHASTVTSVQPTVISPPVGVAVDGGALASADAAAPVSTSDPPVTTEVDTSDDRNGDSCDTNSLSLPIADPVVAVAFDPSDSTRLFALTRSPAQLLFIDLVSGLSSVLQLGGAPVADTGHELFHRSTGANIACASCHPEGRDDGRVWNFEGLGLRRTQPLDIGLANTAPFHWDGLLPTVGALMSEVFVRRMGGINESPERLSALQSWLFARSPLPPRRGSDDPLAVRGKLLFESQQVGCSACHSGPSFTNNLSFNVGTTPGGTLLQVPGLRGIGYRSPLMHDGCAKTLRDRFDPACGGGDHHGVTSTLSSDDIDALVAYLETL